MVFCRWGSSCSILLGVVFFIMSLSLVLLIVIVLMN